MRICIVGNYRWNFYEEALFEGFSSLGHTADRYVINTQGLFSLHFKPGLQKKINNEFLSHITATKPDAIFFYRVNEIYKQTLDQIRILIPWIRLVSYHNDNPYKGFRNRLKYHNYLSCLKSCDLLYVYRPSNINCGYRYGATNVKILMPYYYSKVHLNHELSINHKIQDVVFVGHVEDDGRIDVIDYLIKNKVDVKVYGPDWDKIGHQKSWPIHCTKPPVYQKEYYNVILNSKVALCFFSKANEDIYTRRVFEIPAIGTALATENTEFTRSFFKDGHDVIMFRDKVDLLEKLCHILKSPSDIKRITANGHSKIITTCNSEKDRAAQIVNDLLAIKQR